VIATCFALISFAAAVVVNVAVGNSLQTVVERAIVVMVVCWVIGGIVGSVLQRIVAEHIEKYKRDHPIEDDYPQPGDAAGRRISKKEQAAAPGSAAPAAPTSNP